jgi:hypothetical protein
LQGIEWLVVTIVLLLGSFYLVRVLAPVLRPPSEGMFPVSPVSHGSGWPWLITNFINLFAENFANYGWPVLLVDAVIGVVLGWGISVASSSLFIRKK